MNTSLLCENRRRCILIRGGHPGSFLLVKTPKVVHAMATGSDVIFVCMQIYNWNEVKESFLLNQYLDVLEIVSLEAL